MDYISLSWTVPGCMGLHFTELNNTAVAIHQSEVLQQEKKYKSGQFIDNAAANKRLHWSAAYLLAIHFTSATYNCEIEHCIADRIWQLCTELTFVETTLILVFVPTYILHQIYSMELTGQFVSLKGPCKPLTSQKLHSTVTLFTVLSRMNWTHYFN